MVGLAVFASDALSSNAYATQEMMVVLAAAGTIAFGYVFPISLAIVVLACHCFHFLCSGHPCLSRMAAARMWWRVIIWARWQG
jgi:hypothetical protein